VQAGAQACELAGDLSLRVGLSYRTRPDASIYTLIGHVAEGVL